MTERNPAVWMQAGGETAEDARRAFGFFAYDTAAIATATDFAASASGMTTTIGSGRAIIPGTEATYQGVYHVENRGNKALTHDPSDSTLSRIDLIVAKVQDAAYSGSTNAWSLVIVKGTPAASNPNVPALPANAIPLWQVSVPAGATSVPSGSRTDVRPGVYAAPPQYETGNVSITIQSGTALNDAVVSFAKTWAAPPMVQVTVKSGAGRFGTYLLSDPTTSGFNVRAYVYNGANLSGASTIKIAWFAIAATS